MQASSQQGANVACLGEEKLPIIEVTYQGRYFKWKMPTWHFENEQVPKRAEVTQFSQKSKKRMLELFNRLDWGNLGKCLFVTLTFPDECLPDSNRTISKYLHRFRVKLEKHLERKVPIVWKIEWEERETGARKNHVYPHFHLLIIGVPYIHHAKVNSWWRSIVRYKNKPRTETKGCKNRGRAFIYISKYCAKRNGSLVFGPYLNNPFNGRRWGTLRPELLPMATEHKLRSFETQHLRDAFYAALEGRPLINQYGNLTFTLLGDQAEDVGNFCFGLTIDGEIIDV